MHARISTALQLRGQPAHSRYACFMDNPSKGRTAALHRIPEGAVSLRASIHFPEGPLTTTRRARIRPRTSSVWPATPATPSGGLTVEALRYSSVPASHDPRRQPMQAPPFITGNITVELVASMNGDWAAAGSNFIDEYVQPGSAMVWRRKSATWCSSPVVRLSACEFRQHGVAQQFQRGARERERAGLARGVPRQRRAETG
jgi:hypothetical protein